MRIAADGGIASAMFLLANLYLDGEGLPRDAARAREWLERSAEREHPEANSR